ncbi:LOW QUALITY PROTEIN: N-acetylmuramic acid 6-phosphate etherase [Geomicrobium sp. JCM 19037]|nr:LOW QUALITY PROTEIN: N-acetylmuramic acid 6-phosphate etherase [Geomicrobium sp. JCM 19037]
MTESRNQRSAHIDRQTTGDILRAINAEDQQVATIISKHIDVIEGIVQDAVRALQKGGRLFYVGAGTSGRIGVLDASEIPPTYGTEPELVQAIIAGEDQAIFEAVEGTEDNEELGRDDLLERGVKETDVVIAITASGKAPYVIGALKAAEELGAVTVSFTCNHHAPLHAFAKHELSIEVGPEIVMGSTRMKAGTAQKLVLNMITTTTMIQLGKVYRNLMVDVKPLNKKLVSRSKRMIQYATDCSEERAEQLFHLSGQRPKIAIVMELLNVSKTEAEQHLDREEGFVYRVLEEE